MNTRIEQANKRVLCDFIKSLGQMFGLITGFIGVVFYLIGQDDKFFAIASTILLSIAGISFIGSIVGRVMSDPKNYSYKPLKEIHFYLINQIDGIFDMRDDAPPMANEDFLTLLIYKIISIDEFLNTQINQLEENENIKEVNGIYEVLDEEAYDELQQIYLDSIIRCKGKITSNGKYLDKFKNLNHKLRDRLIDYLLGIDYVEVYRRKRKNGYSYRTRINKSAEEKLIPIVQYMTYLEERGNLYQTQPFAKIQKGN